MRTLYKYNIIRSTGKLCFARGTHMKTLFTKATRRQIDATDKQIDQFVYNKLYDLTEEEIKIVERELQN
jgi:hypothetical protein